MSNFSRTESFDELNWNSQSFSARIAGWEISKFLPTDSVYGITWNISNLKARYFNLFTNLFRVWEYLIFFRFKAWSICFQKTWNFCDPASSKLPEKFRSSIARKSCQKNQPFFEQIPSEKKVDMLQNFVARSDCIKNSIFSQTDSFYENIWNKSNFRSLNKSLLNYKPFREPIPSTR